MKGAAGQLPEGPNPPSWIDRLVEGIDGLPVPAWVFYSIVLAGSVLLHNAIFWIDGGLEFGSLDPDLSVFGFYALYWLALYHYLGRQASRALSRFRSLLEVNDAELQRIDFQLVSLPRNLGLAALPVGAGLAALDIPRNASDAIGPIFGSAQTALPIVYFSLATAFIGSSFMALVLRTIRQLRLASKLHEQASGIDILALDATHAFSGLTARTGLGLILLLILIIIPAPWETGASAPYTVIDLTLYAMIALLSVAVFIIPLEGMHGRLQAEKDRAIKELDELYKSACGRLYSAVRNSRYDEIRHTREAMSALLIHRERLEKISTWPWDPRTLRGFSSALLLPIMLLLVAQLLERLL